MSTPSFPPDMQHSVQKYIREAIMSEIHEQRTDDLMYADRLDDLGFHEAAAALRGDAPARPIQLNREREYQLDGIVFTPALFTWRVDMPEPISFYDLEGSRHRIRLTDSPPDINGELRIRFVNAKVTKAT